jgi:DNA-binding winged helix-turn-helix (wHTH) protein
LKRYAIGHLHLDVEQRVLYLGNEVVALSPKSFDILLVLVENAGQVISRDAIREQVWGDAFIEDANLSNNISMLRATLREHLGDVQVIKTFSKRGYQLTIPVALEGVPQEPAHGQIEQDIAPEQLAPASPSAPPPDPPPALIWKTRSNLVLTALLTLGIAVTLMLIRSARLGTLSQHPVATTLLSGLDRATALLKSTDPLPSLVATAFLLGIAGVMVTLSPHRTDLHTRNWLLGLSFLIVSQIGWILSRESTVHNTIGLVGQILVCLTLAAYKPGRARLRRWWVFYVDVLPLLIFVICCGLDVKKAAIYVGLSAVGRMMLIGTYVLRRDALWPILVAVAGWISMALLAADGRYLGAAFLAIAITSLYAAVNLSLRLPPGNIGKSILVAGTLVWTLYAATYPAAFAYAPLRPLWGLLLHTAKLLVCLGMAVFVWKATNPILDHRESHAKQ